MNHGPIQKSYVDWKYNILKDFVNSSLRFAEKCYYFRTVSHPAFDQLRKQFYYGRKKIVPYRLVEKWLSPFILAVWIMDDGSRDGKQIRINSQSFSKKENLFLRDLLCAKFGIKATLNRDKEKHRLRIGDQSMKKLAQLVKPYVIPSMLYKLPL